MDPLVNLHCLFVRCLFCDYFSVRQKYRLPHGIRESSQFLLQQAPGLISCLVMALSSLTAPCLLVLSVGPTDLPGKLFVPSVLGKWITICFNLLDDRLSDCSSDWFFFFLCVIKRFMTVHYYYYLNWVQVQSFEQCLLILIISISFLSSHWFLFILSQGCFN